MKRFGKDTFRIIEEEPERLVEVKGISERIAQQITDQMIEKREIREAFLFLQKYGITNTLAVKIYEKYGMGMYGILKENPYRLAEDIQGVGFRLADEIAEKIGIHLELEAIAWMLHIFTGNLQILSVIYTPKDPYADFFLIIHIHGQYRIAIVLILINDMIHISLNRFQISVPQT